MYISLPCSGIVTVMTDFGTSSGYAASMKGVMLGINPMLKIVDVTHAISSHKIEEAAFVLFGYYRDFPRGSVHLIVVDPGVGSDRKPIAVETESCYFVAPENGVLDLALSKETVRQAVLLERQKLGDRQSSATFDGRDLFAPAAAWLASGKNLKELGEPHLDFRPACFPQPEERGETLVGKVLYIDPFGNAVTNIDSARVGWDRLKDAVFQLKGIVVEGVVSHYSAVERGECLAVVGSTGFVEIGLREGCFAERYGVCIGDPVVVQWKAE